MNELTILMLACVGVSVAVFIFGRWLAARPPQYRRSKWMRERYVPLTPGTVAYFADTLFRYAPKLDAFELENLSLDSRAIVVLRVRKGSIRPEELGAVQRQAPAGVLIGVEGPIVAPRWSIL